MLEVLLVRHMETRWNEEARYIGRTDLDLSPVGRRYADLLAASLSGRAPGRIISSSRRRAVKTAQALAEPHKIEVVSCAALDEVDFGDWEGLTYTEAAEVFPGLLDDWMANPAAVRIPNGEPWTDFERRVRAAWGRLTEAATDHLTIVTHGGVIKVILGQVLGLGPADYWRIHQDKGAVNWLKYNEEWQAVKLNDTSYR